MTKFLPTGRQDMLACRRNTSPTDTRVFLVSAMLTPALERIGATLGAAGVIGTNIQVGDGRVSGNIVGPVCMGEHKATLTRAY